jgi:hypothetical protein
MKTILILLFLVSCAHKVEDPRKFKTSSQEFNPYKQEWLVNGGGKTIDKSRVSIPIVINFNESIKAIGVCVLRVNIADREIWVNPKEWEENRDKRKYIINNLLSACYGLSIFNHGYYHYSLNSY